jgi:murein L,D-transpeptidase YafK
MQSDPRRNRSSEFQESAIDDDTATRDKVLSQKYMYRIVRFMPQLFVTHEGGMYLVKVLINYFQI